MKILSQYPVRYPNYPSQPIQSQSRVSKKFIYVLAFVAVIAVVVAVVLLMQQKPVAPAECGNGKCESGENCFDCPVDCKCKTNEYCSEQEKKCILPKCGNGICETFESNQNCCEDCKCQGELETCNKQKQKCEIPTISISNEKVKELATQYYKNKGKNVKDMTEVFDEVYQGKPTKTVGVTIEGEEGILYSLYITQSEEIIEVIFY